MTLRADIKTALGSLVSNRVYPDFAPSNPTTPYIVYAQIGGEPLFFYGLESPSKRNATVQIRIWSKTREEAASVALAAAEALTESSTLQAFPLTEFSDDFDEMLQWYGTAQDFSIWYDV